MGSRSWFDGAKLLPGERLLRSAPARVRTDAPPHWWDGELILTSERLFFLPSVDEPFLDDAAFWLSDIDSWRAGRRNRLLVIVDDVEREFELTPPAPVALIARSAARWSRDLASARTAAREVARAAARPRPSAGRPVREGRRAAG